MFFLLLFTSFLTLLAAIPAKIALVVASVAVSFQLTPAMITGLTGAVVSVLFARLPRLRTWFNARSAEAKFGIIVGLMALVTAGVTALHCYGFIDAGISCDKLGIEQVIWWFASAMISNQVTYLVTPVAADVKAIKASRRAAG